MGEWVFNDAYGKYDIDLGDSNVQCIKVGDIKIDKNLLLEYGVNKGTKELRNLVAGLYNIPNNDIAITHGSQESLYLLYRTLLQPGDEVIAFMPGWHQSWEVPKKIGCVVKILNYTDTFEIELDALKNAVTQNTKMIILTTPCNPTGKKISHEVINEIVEIADKHGAYIVADEEYLTDYADSLVHYYDRAISVSSISKVYGLPGLRTGWACGSKEIIDDMIDYKHYTTISNSVLCEKMAVDVLLNHDLYIQRYYDLTKPTYPILKEWVKNNNHCLKIVEPEGTPFAWINLNIDESSLGFCKRVLNNAGVLLMPAELFGAKNGFRITFAREKQQFLEGLSRIDEILTGIEAEKAMQ